MKRNFIEMREIAIIGKKNSGIDRFKKSLLLLGAVDNNDSIIKYINILDSTDCILRINQHETLNTNNINELYGLIICVNALDFLRGNICYDIIHKAKEDNKKIILCVTEIDLNRKIYSNEILEKIHNKLKIVVKELCLEKGILFIKDGKNTPNLLMKIIDILSRKEELITMKESCIPCICRSIKLK